MLTSPFSDSDVDGTNPYDNDPMVTTIQHDNWNINRVLVDLGSYDDVLFWDAFQKLQLDPNKIKVFIGLLIRLLGDKVQVRGT